MLRLGYRSFSSRVNNYSRVSKIVKLSILPRVIVIFTMAYVGVVGQSIAQNANDTQRISEVARVVSALEDFAVAKQSELSQLK